ncbi:sensor histidine kinase [Streptomyces smyrnaeus]|uniref:sensor histidine kinase n=1 Tax=Streptomyces TaxID=1883 RepID=UPI0016083602|nr:ATP-binding protein [Streptomyces sp. B15]MBQ1122153.1 GHKL domain-containing protein [Streptomyces sp. B15]MBQ1156664.1 GHKL domain-containing protein [Streptomyces sp. A73]
MDATPVLPKLLKSQGHDFTNGLHTLLGLLELDMYDRAGHFVTALEHERPAPFAPVVERIHEPLVRALLIGKGLVAAQWGAALQISADAWLRRPVAHPRDLVIVMGNLIDNALEAVRGQTCRSPRVEAGLRSDGDAVALWVSDNGPGVPMRLRKRIFSEGWSSKQSSDGHARGIGLAQVQHIADSYRGRVRVRDRAGGGAVFSVRLPRPTGTPAPGGSQ